MRTAASRVATFALAGWIALAAGWQQARLIATWHHDPRDEASTWLAARATAETAIEVYAKNYQLPRLPQFGRAWRVDRSPVNKRNPIEGLEERPGPYAAIEARDPTWVGWGPLAPVHLHNSLAPTVRIFARTAALPE